MNCQESLTALVAIMLYVIVACDSRILVIKAEVFMLAGFIACELTSLNICNHSIDYVGGLKRSGCELLPVKDIDIHMVMSNPTHISKVWSRTVLSPEIDHNICL